jgi:nitrite reductase/ring-hydroxylating ferredoxin subunit
VVLAIAARCSHAGGPLEEGEVDDDLCVTCPWHGSHFRLADGSVVRGPASAPQPSFEVRSSDGNIEVRLRAE